MWASRSHDIGQLRLTCDLELATDKPFSFKTPIAGHCG
jgi:hypothetical protein